jgi:hypothetical protein
MSPSIGSAVGSVDLPDQPDNDRRVEQSDTRGADRSTVKSREILDPDERGRAYDAIRAHVSAETPEQPSPNRQPEGNGVRTYLDEVSRFHEMRAEHEKRWPTAERSAVDRSVYPERHADADAIVRMREAEPRVSEDVQAIEHDNKYGGWLEGFKYRFKDEDRLREKIAAKLEVEPGMTVAGALGEVGDAIRYTYCFQPESHARGYYDIKERLESRGHEMYYSQNHWSDPEYKGINTRWVTPHGQRFEVQLHTPESHHAKEYVTHWAYERIRDPATSDEERGQLKAFQREVSSRIRIPNGATDIPDYRKERF